MDLEDLLCQPLEETEFCVLDTETTGISAKWCNIIEIGMIKIKDGIIIDRYSSFINPGSKIPYFITSLTGISDDDVYDAPFFDQCAEDIINFMDGCVLVGHNLSFDIGFLAKEFQVNGYEPAENLKVCTLKLARRLYPEIKKKNLSSVCNHLGIYNKHAHRALDDAEVTSQVLMRQIETLRTLYDISNVNDLVHFQFMPLKQNEIKLTKKNISLNLPILPRSPGVYCFMNSKGEIIYIGKAKCISDRVKSYFGQAASTKAKKIVRNAKKLKIELTNSELTALLYESESIKIVDPKMNVMLKKYGSKYFLRINKTMRFPTIELVNKFDFDGNDYFGLFISRKKAAAILEIIHKVFLIRECKEKEFESGRGCLLNEIERCTSPCTNEDIDLYTQELQQVYDFIYGNNQFALDRLLKRMKYFSDKMEYEKAGELKQLIELILSQITKSALLAEPINSAKILLEIDEGFGRDFIILMQGKIYVKTNENDYDFETVLNDYFEQNINIDFMPNNEDLEKMKIILNWIVNNRSKVKVYYLKEFKSISDLSKKVAFNQPSKKREIKYFNLDGLYN